MGDVKRLKVAVVVEHPDDEILGQLEKLGEKNKVFS